MKHLKTPQELNEASENLNISDVMRRSVEYYEYIDKVGRELSEIISKQIEPLLKENKYDEAKKMVRDFYEPSRWKNEDSEGQGDVIFIEYDMILANINRMMKNVS
jgi:hypothetical protein